MYTDVSAIVGHRRGDQSCGFFMNHIVICLTVADWIAKDLEGTRACKLNIGELLALSNFFSELQIPCRDAASEFLRLASYTTLTFTSEDHPKGCRMELKHVMFARKSG